MNARAAMPPPAVVLSCAGAPEGDLNLVRSLGEQGAHVIVMSEYDGALSSRSRHCAESIVVPDFTLHPDRLLAALVALRARLGVEPVVFPSADPDLAALIRIADQLPGVARSSLIDPGLTAALSDKKSFQSLAESLDLPVPATVTPTSLPALESQLAGLTFPLILKPSHPVSWKKPGLPQAIRSAKALQVDTLAQALALGRQLIEQQADFLAQEFVPGDDEEHYDVHAYIDRQGQVVATYSGRKWRIYPPHAGSGCYVESLWIEELEALAVDILKRLGYRGIANINFKRHAITGEYKLFEINPRVSQWHILPTRSGVNIPWLAFEDLAGLAPRPRPTRTTGTRYMNERTDARAMRVYAREGKWRWLTWWANVLSRRCVHQLLQLGDPKPAWHALRGEIRVRLGLPSEH